MLNKILFILFHLLICTVGIAQTYVAGETYFGENDYIEYKAGNLPIVISAPHGGVLEPNAIPNRNCSGCVYVRDTNTEELIRQMYDAIFELFGCYPHVIINRLHRRKLDANRAIGDAADGNALAEQAWHDFHHFINAAKDSVFVKFGKGLYLDLHGHGHEIQRLELGYRITKSELQLPNATLDNDVYVESSSIKNLVKNNRNDLTLSELLRGPDSFGELYEDETFPAVPSQIDPFPFDDESYFSGGYNTLQHGSELGGTIDGIQIECNMDGVRDTYNNREEFAASTAIAVKAYLETHYFGDNFLDGTCGLISSTKENPYLKEGALSIHPNPVDEHMTIELPLGNHGAISISIFNELGQTIYQDQTESTPLLEINTTAFPKGFYFLEVQSETYKRIRKFIKQ